MKNPSPPTWLFDPVTLTKLQALIALAKRPNNPYNLTQTIHQLDGHTPVTTHGVRKALIRMAAKGWIKHTDRINTTGRNEQTYDLTDFGAAELDYMLLRLSQLTEHGEHYLAVYRTRQADSGFLEFDL